VLLEEDVGVDAGLGGRSGEVGEDRGGGGRGSAWIGVGTGNGGNREGRRVGFGRNGKGRGGEGLCGDGRGRGSVHGVGCWGCVGRVVDGLGREED
jgi:hypothetical protein